MFYLFQLIKMMRLNTSVMMKFDPILFAMFGDAAVVVGEVLAVLLTETIGVEVGKQIELGHELYFDVTEAKGSCV